ncbi:MAG: hypothetical protein KQH53_14310 [Desulfarculaceae bacterium]|nr:hypothetical protein [Desulfarculaceae bacterium]
MRKFIWIGVLVVLLAAAGVAYYAFSNLDSFAKGFIEKAGSQALGVAVKVDSVNLQLSERQATVKGLTVANPPGYSSQPAMSFASITVQVGEGDANIKKIEAINPKIRVELKGKENNLSQLQAQAKKAEGKPSPSAAKKDDPVFSIGLLRVQGAQATITGPDLKQPVDLGVRDLEMKNLKGTASQIAGQVFDRLLGITLEKAASVAVQRGLGQIINKEAGYGSEVTNFLEKLGGVKK